MDDANAQEGRDGQPETTDLVQQDGRSEGRFGRRAAMMGAATGVGAAVALVAGASPAGADGGSISEITSVDGSIAVTDPTGPTTDLSAAYAVTNFNPTSGSPSITASQAQVIMVNATGNATGSSTINTPAAAAGVLFWVTRTDGTAGSVVVVPSSGTVNGVASFVINGQYQTYGFLCDGTNWHVIAGFSPALDITLDQFAEPAGNLNIGGYKLTNVAAPTSDTDAARLVDISDIYGGLLATRYYALSGGDSTATSSTTCAPFWSSELGFTFTPVGTSAVIEIEGCFQLSWTGTESTYRGCLTVVKSSATTTPLGYWSVLHDLTSSGGGEPPLGFFRQTARIVIPAGTLTAGSSVTVYPAWAVTNTNATLTAYCDGSQSSTPGATTRGPITMRAYAN